MMSENEMGMIAIALGIVLAALGGFAIGLILGDNRKRTHRDAGPELFNPTLRPDEYAQTR